MTGSPSSTTGCWQGRDLLSYGGVKALKDWLGWPAIEAVLAGCGGLGAAPLIHPNLLNLPPGCFEKELGERIG